MSEFLDNVRPYFTREQAARYLNVSMATLARWASRDEGPAYYRLGRHAKYLKDDLDAFLNTRRRPA